MELTTIYKHYYVEMELIILDIQIFMKSCKTITTTTSVILRVGQLMC